VLGVGVKLLWHAALEEQATSKKGKNCGCLGAITPRNEENLRMFRN
jgi:hypothetical protein